MNKPTPKIYRTTNWPTYNRALINRGNIAIWFDPKTQWYAQPKSRHVWLQHLPPDQVPSCGPGLNYLIDALPMKTVLQEVLSGSGECAAIDWTFLGQSLPVWSLAYFLLLLLVCLWQLFRFYPVFKTAKK